MGDDLRAKIRPPDDIILTLGYRYSLSFCSAMYGVRLPTAVRWFCQAGGVVDGRNVVVLPRRFWPKGPLSLKELEELAKDAHQGVPRTLAHHRPKEWPRAKPRPPREEILRVGGKLSYQEAGAKFGVAGTTFSRWYFQAGGKKVPGGNVPTADELNALLNKVGLQERRAARSLGVNIHRFRKWCELRKVVYYDPAQYIRASEASRRLGLSRAGIRVWHRLGYITFVKLDRRHIVVPVEEVNVLGEWREGHVRPR